MADYFAVLQRTLSGFTDPKPQLRTKLYERARVTIAKQLENRAPPVTGAALTAEMDKLERAIADIEQGYDPTYPDPTPTAEPVPEVASEPVPELEMEPAPVPTSEPIPEPAPAAEPEPVVDAAPGPESSDPYEATPEPEPVEPEPIIPPPSAEVPAEVEAFLEAELPSVAVPEAINKQSVTPVPTDIEPDPQIPYEAGIAEALDALQSKPETSEQAVEPDPVGQWAEEFMAAQNQPEPVATLPPVAELSELAPISDPVYDPIPPQETTVAAPVFEPQYNTENDDSLSIPPAVGFGSGGSKRPKKRGFLKWILLLILLGLIGALGAYGWTNKEMLLEKTGMSDFFEDPNDPTRPKPVKTIKITPEPETPEPEDSSSAQPEPKVERRLTADGREIETVQPKPIGTTELTPTVPEVEPATSNPGAPLVSQKAILYEEGSTSSENTADAGRVVWSVVQESPAAGEPKEPAIRARIEIPSRNTILIMTIKRNGDRALPASHLIELIFAVPDDFSGGAIGQVNRFVLKESEQGRGEGLVAVPAWIADGIFLIALNNLEEAISKNETLMQSRSWIDIPMQYRTGRRALMTIEKGVPGEQVFKEVFEAWAAKKAGN